MAAYALAQLTVQSDARHQSRCIDVLRNRARDRQAGTEARGAAGEGDRGRLGWRAEDAIARRARLMSQQTVLTPRTKTKAKVERPKLWKVILLNDDYTPREFVVTVLKAVFRMGEEKAYAVMLTAHRRGACVIAVFTRDVADTKAKEATDLGRQKGYPLYFTTEPEE